MSEPEDKEYAFTGRYHETQYVTVTTTAKTEQEARDKIMGHDIDMDRDMKFVDFESAGFSHLELEEK